MNGLYGSCQEKLKVGAKRQWLGGPYQALWLASLEDGAQALIQHAPHGGSVTFLVRLGDGSRYQGEVLRNGPNRVDTDHNVTKRLTRRVLRVVEDAVPVPPPWSIYGVRNSRTYGITALLYAQLVDHVLKSWLYIESTSPMPHLWVSGVNGQYLAPDAWDELVRQQLLVRCDQLIGTSQYPVRWNEGDAQGRGSYFVIADPWTGLPTTAVYEHWQSRGTYPQDEAKRRSGSDIRRRYHR